MQISSKSEHTHAHNSQDDLLQRLWVHALQEPSSTRDGDDKRAQAIVIVVLRA